VSITAPFVPVTVTLPAANAAAVGVMPYIAARCSITSLSAVLPMTCREAQSTKP
jgi:hypothetical protein